MYYIRAKQLDGELLQISNEPLTQEEGEIIKIREGDIPDLTRYKWHPNSLCFVEYAPERFMTHTSFIKRFTADELRSIYSSVDASIDMKIWFDKFKMAQDVWLDHPDLVYGLYALAQMSILTSERVQEILS